MKLLVAEDDRRVRSFVARGLREEGYVVVECEDGKTALEKARGVDLVLLDWMLPAMAGIDVVTALRARGEIVPIVMLTAKDAVEDRVAALNAGADDYLVKPFSFEELLARIRAVSRRATPRKTPLLSVADLTLDPVKHKIARAGKEIRLTAREFALLQYLMEHAGEVVSRTRIAHAVWEHDFDTMSNVVEVYVRALRKKVDLPFRSPLLHTVRGMGYALRKEP